MHWGGGGGGLCKAVLAGGRDRKPRLQKNEGQGLCVASCYSTVVGGGVVATRP